MAQTADKPTSLNPTSAVEESPKPEGSQHISILPQGIDEPETITKTEFLAKCQNDPEELFEGLLRMWEADQEDKEHWINCTECHTENLRQQLDAQESQIIELITEQDKY